MHSRYRWAGHHEGERKFLGVSKRERFLEVRSVNFNLWSLQMMEDEGYLFF